MKEEDKQKFCVYAVPRKTPYVINDYEGFMKRVEEQKQDSNYNRMMESLERMKFNIEEMERDGVIKLELKRKIPNKK